MNRNIAKPFAATLSLLDVASDKTNKYKCFHGEDIQLTVNVVGENNRPLDLSNTSVKIFFTLDKNVNEPVYRQDTGIVVNNLGIITVMLEKSYIRIGNNTLKIVLYDEDQTVFLQPLIISCIDPLIGETPDLETPDDINVRDEIYDIRRIIGDFGREIIEARNEYGTVGRRLDNFDSQLDAIAIQIKNGDDIQAKINYAIENNLNVCGRALNVSEKITIDLLNKSNINIDLEIFPSDNIDDVLYIKNGISTKCDIKIISGGHTSSRGLIIENLKYPKIKIIGENFNGILLNNNGYVEDNNKNSFCEIELISKNCGQAFSIGDDTKTVNAFGKFYSIFDTSQNGSKFINASDITIDSIENAFFQIGKTYLTFDKCYSVYIGNCALGGICGQMISVNKSFIHIDKLLLINDIKPDVTGYTMNGIKITASSLSATGNTSMVSVNTLDTYNMDCVIDIDSFSNVSFNLIRPHANNKIILRKDNTSQSLPNYMPSSYTPRKKILLEDSELNFRYNGLNIDIIEEVKKLKNYTAPVVNKQKLTKVAGTGEAEVLTVVFPTPHLTIPIVTGLVTANENFKVYAESVTKTGFDIIFRKYDGTKFAGETLNVYYRTEDS